MDTLRGAFDPEAYSDRDWDASDDDSGAPAHLRDLPPEAIGGDERRMQVRAYNHWASLLGDRLFPNIVDLDPADIADFGPNSVLLDFTEGPGNPAVRFLGDALGRECGATGIIDRLSDVPARSLLSRITDHYMQILVNRAPIGFEAEFVNHAGVALLYRGILLPYSSDDRTIDYIYGVINWKEMADQLTADELLLEIDQALELGTEQEIEPAPVPVPASPRRFASLAESLSGDGAASGAYTSEDEEDDLPDFSLYGLDDDEEYDEDEGEDESAAYNFASLADYIETPVKKAIDLTALEPLPLPGEYAPAAAVPTEYVPDYAPVADEPVLASEPVFEDEAFEDEAYELAADAVFEAESVADEDHEAAEDFEVAAEHEELTEDAGLHDCLAAARELARAADSTEDRSRAALYAAVSRAYDFSLAAQEAPDAYAELVAESGLTVQERAPMTPVVKLVFGADYDKTRLTEYAAVLTHAHRLRLERGSLAGFLAQTEGGVKAIVKAERQLRREGQGKPLEAAAVREALAQALRALTAMTLEELDGAGPEFALVLVRRDEIGCAEIVAEVPEDIALIERAARKVVG